MMLTADGFDKAILGNVSSFGRKETVLYSVRKMLDIMKDRDGMTEDEAVEFFNFNILGSYNGEGMPSFFNDHEKDLEFYE
jgi:hypothetical protein